MKKIKVRFVDQPKPSDLRRNTFGKIDKENPAGNHYLNILRKRYIVDEESYPDYVFTCVPVWGGWI